MFIPSSSICALKRDARATLLKYSALNVMHVPTLLDASQEIVYLVTGKGVSPDSRDPQREWASAIHFASIHGNEGAVEALIALDADVALLDNTMSSPLHK